jgi:tetratricopeptide (TPR) repeat protein
MDPGPWLAETLKLLRTRRAADALALLARAPTGLRDHPRVRARYAYAYGLTGRIQDAIAAARLAMASADLDKADLDLVGNALVLCHRPALAHEAFQRALDQSPHDIGALFNLAASARFMGQAEAAETLYDRLIAQAPDVWEAYRNRSELRRQTTARNHIAELTRRLAAGPPPRGEVQLRYALGKEYEDLGEFERAFEAFAAGARTRRRNMRYDVGEDVAALDLIRATFDEGYCAPARVREAAPGPIFIVGLPRTGSTLLERMLGRHSQIQPLGELQTFASALVKTTVASSPTRPGGKADLIQASATTPPGAIGQAYLEGVRPLRDARPFFIDKLPLNALYVGAIARALPCARIVHLTREPADACVAIFKTLFDEAYPFSYDLKELGTYFNAHQALMAHWRGALGPRLIETRYEDLTQAPAATLKALFEALDLDLEPDCLRPEDDAAPVMTASASQVRDPINTRSVKIAERYAPWIEPLLEVLEAH